MWNVLKKSAGRLSVGWYWGVGLLILPACGFTGGTVNPTNLDNGVYPYNSAVFCDIEKALGRRCATSQDKLMGIRFSDAAVALNEGRTSNVALDDSADALARCGGDPEAVLFEGPFPQGYPVCLNCSAIGTAAQPDVNVACKKQCMDFYGTYEGDQQYFVPEYPPNPSVESFCNATARASTNFPVSTCFAGACSNDGTLLTTGWSDPRRVPEPVIWADLIGVAPGGAAGNDLTRTAATTGNFDAGAASAQWITRGDAYVEFSAIRNDLTHPLGLSEIPPGCPAPCPDTDPSFSIGFAIGLGNDGLVYIVRNGTTLTTLGPYIAGQRFRVRVRDNGNGTGTVSASRVEGVCVPGTLCNQTTLYTFTPTATYPLRVDTTSFEQGATLVDVRMVRIQ